MKLLLSLNYKFFDISPKDLIDKVLNHANKDVISGFEVCIDFDKNYEVNYLKELVYLCKDNNFILQLHGNSCYDLDKQYNYLDYVNELSKVMDKNIDIVFHPLSCNTIDESIRKTDIYFSKILNYIYVNNYKVNVSIENLNSMVDCVRLSKDYLTSILYNNIDLYFTYDIGHEIMEYGKLIDLDDVFIERLRNVHFHTFNNVIEHLPVDYHEYNKDGWVKALLYLKSLNFKGTLVLEYNFYELGNSYNERFDNYLNCCKFISNYL